MFGDKRFDVDDYFQVDSFTESTSFEMSFELALYIFGIVVLFVLLIACCMRCCCRRDRGQVLSPPSTQVQVQVPYPQQQYNAPYPTQVVTTYPVHTGTQVAYPHSTGQPYVGIPPSSLNSAPAPFTAPYPASAYPGAPYPSSGYPGGAYHPSAPSAPEANAMPPCYEQAVGAKPPPNNPYSSQ